jgi:hypothetical protein
MAAPALQVGTYVQYNAANDNPQSSPPSSQEGTVGIIRQAFFQQGEPYYQVVWNPGDAFPKSAIYHEDQLCSVTQQQAQSIMQQIAAGVYTPSAQTPGSGYQQPTIPNQALPPGLQSTGQNVVGVSPATNP